MNEDISGDRDSLTPPPPTVYAVDLKISFHNFQNNYSKFKSTI